MSEAERRNHNLAERGVHILCQDQETNGLSDAQKQALHACKLAIVAAIRHLYVSIPPAQADEILSKYIKIPHDELPS